MLPNFSIFRSGTALLSLSTALIAFSSAAQADITISSAATQNMTCSGGVCTPTATNAVLNSGDLETLLASGNVAVTTTGSGVQANNIVVGDGVSWSSSSALTLDAYQSVSIDKGIAVQSQAGLSLITNDGGTGGTLAFGHKGSVSFANLSSGLTINGTAYTLVNTIQSLAAAIAANPAGAYALASNYDASQDGTYTTVPVPTPFTGTFEGLGNAVSNLSINDTSDEGVGLFAEVDAGGTLRDVAVDRANVFGAGDWVGMLVGTNAGLIENSSSSGTVAGQNGQGGGLAGGSTGTIVNSRSAANVSGFDYAGGLVGVNTASSTLMQSYATGNVSGANEVGGLVGENDSSGITNCYSTGRATTTTSGQVGGFLGANAGDVADSYSIGRVKGGIMRRSRGGLTGYDLVRGDINSSYWDVDKSGMKNRQWGAGNIKHDSGITGLTTQQLRTGLPGGFDPSIWSEDRTVNGGLPYLVANPPG